MTIKEVESATGLERANIRFYEQQKLITPRRLENGYRDYSQEDIDILLKIKLLRCLHISLEEIEKLKKGSENLSQTLERQIALLQKEQQTAERAQFVCCQIRQDQATFSNMNTRKYLEQLSCYAAASAAGQDSGFSLEEDTLPPASCPWRRYFARLLDLSLYNAAFQLVFLGLLFRINLLKISPLANFFLTYVAIMLMIVIEPALLYLFGTTPGKALMGLRIEGANGGRLPYREGLIRTWGIFYTGLGFQIPIYNIYRLVKCYQLCRDGRALPWDGEIDVSYTVTRDSVGIPRGIAYVASHILLFFLFFLTLLFQRLAPNRGSLNVTQFVENFNYFADYFDYDFGNDYLDENGQWQTARENGTYTIHMFKSVLPQFTYTTDGNIITGVSFTVDIENPEQEWLETYSEYQLLSALAFVQARPEVGLFSRAASQINDCISAYRDNPQDYQIEIAGAELSCHIEYENLYYVNGISLLIPEDGTDNSSLHIEFQIK